MTIRSKLNIGPVGIAASATLAIGALGALPIQSAFAETSMPPPLVVITLLPLNEKAARSPWRPAGSSR